MAIDPGSPKESVGFLAIIILAIVVLLFFLAIVLGAAFNPRP